LPEIGDKQIFKAVVVVVANTDARRPTDVAQAGLVGDVSEGPIAIVPVQTVCGPNWRAFELCPAQKKNVDPSVIVVVNECAAAAGCFENVVFRVGIAINDRSGQASSGGYVDEMCVKRPARWSRLGLRLY